MEWALGASMRLFFVVIVIVWSSGFSRASTVYHWEGNCTLGCTGTATADLTLASGTPFNFNPNYFPNHDVSGFISFQYTSSSGSLFMDNSSPISTPKASGMAFCWKRMVRDPIRFRSSSGGRLTMGNSGNSCMAHIFGNALMLAARHGPIMSFEM
jgi:hypothetical protein